MAAKKLLTFIDLINYCQEQLGVQSSDAVAKNKIKRAINNWYINEIVPHKRWWFLRKSTKIVHKQFYTGGTCAITPDTTTVTLSVAPQVSLGSFARYKFAVDGFDEIYDISAHTAASTTITLSSNYQGTLVTAGTFKIWKDYVDLPVDCREVIEAGHNRIRTSMEGKGFQEFRKIVSHGPRTLSLPTMFHVSDFYAPTSPEVDSDRYRQMLIHPSITDQGVTLNIDYVQDVDALDADSDEPLLPIEDRVVIAYGALSDLWRTIGRNETEAAFSLNLYNTKLARMSGKIEEGFDAPILQPKGSYVRAKRTSRIGSRSAFFSGEGLNSGNSSYGAPTYLEDVTIAGAVVTSNITVNNNVTIDGRDISVDGTTLDLHTTQIATLNNGLAYLEDVVPLTTVELVDNATTTAISVPHGDFNALKIDYYLSRGSSNLQVGQLMLVTDGTDTSLGEAVFASLGTLGVTIDSTISGSNVIIRGTLTSTGTNAMFSYKMHKILI